MRRLDRLGWTAAFVVDAYGTRVGVRSDSASLLRAAAERCPPAAPTVAGEGEDGDVVVERLFTLHSGARDISAGARPQATLYDGGAVVARATDREALLGEFELALRTVVSDASPTHLFVHAGVVGYRGQAILVPGACLAGKTTLVRALLALGAEYYSDDVAVVDEDGRVLPYARPLSVRESAAAPQRPVSAESLGARVGRAPLRAGVVALATYREGAEWRPRALRGGEATLSLLRHTGAVQTRPARALDRLSLLLAGATVLRGARGEADSCARELLRVVDARIAAGSDSPAAVPSTLQTAP
jgi:hypothetical protein